MCATERTVSIWNIEHGSMRRNTFLFHHQKKGGPRSGLQAEARRCRRRAGREVRLLPDDAKTSPTLFGRLAVSPPDQAAWNAFVERYGPRILLWRKAWALPSIHRGPRDRLRQGCGDSLLSCEDFDITHDNCMPSSESVSSHRRSSERPSLVLEIHIPGLDTP
jgi:hypothetical protein